MPNTSSTFSLFSDLVPELRLKIWQYACTPRVVEVRYNMEQDRCMSLTSPPAVLQATRESREEALRSYKLSFATRSNPPHIYFNQDRDTLYLPRHRQMGYDETLRDFRDFLVQPQLIDDVKWLALDHVDIEIKRPWESYNKAVLVRGCQMLEEVILVMALRGDPRAGLKKDLVFVEPKEEPETLLRIWANFRQSFTFEERLLREVSKEAGTSYRHYSLPRVRIKSRTVREQQFATGMVESGMSSRLLSLAIR
jgi:hypothetical protein